MNEFKIEMTKIVCRNNLMLQAILKLLTSKENFDKIEKELDKVVNDLFKEIDEEKGEN